jgi:hypothetical protein
VVKSRGFFETFSPLSNATTFMRITYMTISLSLMASSILRDVEILEQSGIIESKLTADKQGVANVINNFLAGTTMSATKFYYADLCEALNVYCSVPWHKWIATLRHDYFTTTWDGLSIIVAAILLILTFIQTLCSIVSI